MKTDTSKAMLAMSAPPYWHCGQTVFRRSMDMLIALAPAAVMSVCTWGISSARVMAVAILSAVATEAAASKVMKRRIRVDDLTAVVSALLLAFLLPASAPWWIVALGSAAAIL
ncbi:MAG: RnfABCDGE type electron transport complex subunit D, partial [Mailhella sp.]|nr:RnfABCDGE type electron transport complex subunit D [Mailhella sp.]